MGEKRYPVTLSLTAYAGADIEDVIAGAVHVARINSCSTEISVNGVDVLAYPDDNAATLYRNWRVALHRGARFVSGNVIPRGPQGQAGYTEDAAVPPDAQKAAVRPLSK